MGVLPTQRPALHWLTGVAVASVVNLGCVGPWQYQGESPRVEHRDVVYLGHQPNLKVGRSSASGAELEVTAEPRCRLAERGDLNRVERRTVLPGWAGGSITPMVLGFILTVSGSVAWKEGEAGGDTEAAGKGLLFGGLGLMGLAVLLIVPTVTAGFERHEHTGRAFARWQGAAFACADLSKAATVPGHLGATLEADPEGRPVVAKVWPGFPAEGQLEPGDHILRVGALTAGDLEQLRSHLALVGAGGVTPLTVRRGGDEREVTLTLIAEPGHVGNLARQRLNGQHNQMLAALGLNTVRNFDRDDRAKAEARIAEVIEGGDPEAFAELSEAVLGQLRPIALHVDQPPALDLDPIVRTDLHLPSGSAQPLRRAGARVQLDATELGQLTTWMKECGPDWHSAEVSARLELPRSTLSASGHPPAAPRTALTPAALDPAVATLDGWGTPALLTDAESPILADARRCVAQAWQACLDGEVARCDQALRYAPTPAEAEPLESARYHAQRDRCAGNPEAGRGADPAACDWLARTAVSDDEAVAYQVAARRAEEVVAAQTAERRRLEEEALRQQAEAKAALEAAEAAERLAQEEEARLRKRAQDQADADAENARRRDTINAMIGGIQQATNEAVAAQTATRNEMARAAQAQAETRRQREARADQARAADRLRKTEAQREQLARQLERTLPAHQQNLKNAADPRSRQVAEARLRAATDTINAVRSNRPLPASAQDPRLNATVFVQPPAGSAASRPLLTPTPTVLDFASGGNVAGLPPPRPRSALTPGDGAAATVTLCPAGWEPVPGFKWGSKCAVGPCGCVRSRTQPEAAVEGPAVGGGQARREGPTWVSASGPGAPAPGGHGSPTPTSSRVDGPSQPKAPTDGPLGPVADADGCWDGLTPGLTPCVTVEIAESPGHMMGDIHFIFSNQCDRRVVIEFCFVPETGRKDCGQQNVLAKGRSSFGADGPGRWWLGWVGSTRGSQDWVCIGRARKHNQGNFQTKPDQR